ncbi:DUF3109 family protein [Sediminicola luteus]|uniref:DUF3109 domain-containing protein n=1 Tax=Sediminicola luteus TaxID=319238 RepID=A0A2A4GEC3_9FLAO|nr:DUF3109 family protein [Sediminicola luteus]PCE66354.1 hypothetical protein B7P33_03385 [Sediminicola luteus]
MFELGKTIVSEEIFDNDFVCNLSACKGACCVEGSAGAPLFKDELEVLAAVAEPSFPFLRPEGIAAIKEQGPYIKGNDGDWETPLVNDRECAYVIFTEGGMTKCGLEAAYEAGAISWKKPISCHLYPVRLREYTHFTAVNYHRWHICDDACSLGKELQVPVYKFVKEALVRKFGEAWYAELEQAAADYLNGR